MSRRYNRPHGTHSTLHITHDSFRIMHSAFRIPHCALVLFLLFCFTSCIDEDEYPDTPEGNFEALWHIMDEHYCFFGLKQKQYGLDWNEVYTRYAPRFHSNMTQAQQFEVLADMLSELRDGHVNLYSSFDVGRNWSWYEDYPQNFSEDLQRNYLKTDYKIAGSLRYRVLDDNIGYIYCGSFQSSIGAGNLDDVLTFLAPCNALIIDIRDNGGGQLTAAEQLASRFTNEEILVGYQRHKTGPAHDAFSALQQQRLKPAKGVRWQKPVAVLTNRSVFSAANEFVKYMRCCPRVTIVGDQTGGGAGLPFSSELPGGWGVRLSACPMYDRDTVSTENGILPDHAVALTEGDSRQGKDSIIEYARKILRQKFGR